MKQLLLKGTTLLFVISLFITCNKPEFSAPKKDVPPPLVKEYHQPAASFKATIQGIVTDINGNAVAGASVKAGNLTVITDNNGVFELTDATFTGDFCYVKATKKGYFTGSNTLRGKAAGTYQVQVVLPSYERIFTYNSLVGKVVTIDNKATVSFPPKSVKKPDGTLYNGTVTVNMCYFDPAAKNFSQLIPGGDLRAFSNRGEDVMLRSFGMMNVELADAAGNPLQLAQGAKATLSFVVPQTMLTSAPSTIPLWYFDEEKGIWIEDGEAKLKDGKYTGDVTHFTPWNVDILRQQSIIKGRLTDCNAKPLRYGQVRIGQVNARANAEGIFEQPVFPGKYTLEILDEHGQLYTGVSQTANVSTSGQIQDVGVIKAPCMPKVEMEVKDCGGSSFNGYAIMKYENKSYLKLITNGRYEHEVMAAGKPASLYFHKHGTNALHQLSLTLPEHSTLSMGTITVCKESSATAGPIFKLQYDDGVINEVNFTSVKIAAYTYLSQTKKTKIVFVSNNSAQDSAVIIYPGSQGSHVTINPANPNGPKEPQVIMYLNSKREVIKSHNISLEAFEDGLSGREGKVYAKGIFSGTFTIVDHPWVIPKVVKVSVGEFAVERLFTTGGR